jgi:hypothetical protein
MQGTIEPLFTSVIGTGVSSSSSQARSNSSCIEFDLAPIEGPKVAFNEAVGPMLTEVTQRYPHPLFVSPRLCSVDSHRQRHIVHYIET